MTIKNLPETPSFRLEGKRALVAGASQGIGLASAVALAEAGAHVTLAARNYEKLKALHEALSLAGLHSDFATLDVTDNQAINAFLSEREGFDVLVNSAGLARHGPALDLQEADFDQVIAVNLRASFFLSRAVARGMIERGGGSIITISSQMGHIGGPDRVAYCASKHANEGMTKVLAIEWGPHNIRVNTICPTFIRTELAEQTLSRPDRLAWIKERIKLGRLGELEDVMGPVVFLASQASSLITGTHVIVDGGWLAGG